MSFSFSVSLLIILYVFSCNLTVRLSAVQLKTKQGILDGFLSQSRNGTEFYTFYSIPFAKPPVGELRFESPQEADNWEGVRDAKTPTPSCIQMDELTALKGSQKVMGTEDCLYLNVFTPNITFSTLLPVLVFIHGGGFSTESSMWYDPQYLMDNSIVVVTINYRLAILGFLSAADEILPGNYGMKDQTEALKWVQKHIDAFGGDPKRVTIAGESAGGGSVHLHLYSPLSSGLFHGVISSSGTALSPWAVVQSRTAGDRARTVGVLSGCLDLETKALKECLKKVPAEELAVIHNKMFVFAFTPVVLFAPVVEPTNAHNPFLIKDPWKQDVVNSVPLMIGVMADEGSFFAIALRLLTSLLDEATHNCTRMLSLLLSYFDRPDVKDLPTFITSIRKYYFGDNNLKCSNEKNLSDMIGDSYFTVSSVEAARRHNNSVFYYLYDYKNNYSYSTFFTNTTVDMGVPHGSDLISLFYLRGMFPPLSKDMSADYAVSERVVNYWVNFVQKGEPNGKDIVWKPFGGKNFEYLHIKSDADVMNEKLFYDKYKFWNDTLFSPIMNYHPDS